MTPLRRTLALVALALLALACGAQAASAATEPWRAAQQVQDGLFRAQTDLVLDDRASAQRAVRGAARAYAGPLAEGTRGVAPDVRGALAAARAAVRRGDQVALAEARGTVRAALLRGSFATTLAAAARGDAVTARRWLLLRDFRTATRFTRPGADATLAVERLARRTLSPAATRQAVAKDLLDASQARVRELLADARRGDEQDLPARRAEAAAQAQGTFAVLRDRYVEDRGAAAAARAADAFAALERTSVDGGRPFLAAVGSATQALEGFTAAPFTDEEAARRAQQLLRFLALVPVEYGRGVQDGKVTKDFEIQEAVAFRTGAKSAFDDLRDQLAKADEASTRAAAAGLDRLGGAVDRAQRTPDAVASADAVEGLTERTEQLLRQAMPERWEAPTDESDYDLIDLTLDRMEAAVGAGQYQQAEQARLEAYAFFEFGPERRLRSFDPGLALDVEGLIWFGAAGEDGLAELIADRAPRRDIRETRITLDAKLADAAATLGDAANQTTVVTNAAIIVFREGLEGVLILAAITASMIGVRRRLRRPVMVGAIAGLLVSLVTWVLAQTLLDSLDQYGEKLEAVVGLIAIGVLLLITNWFFHKVYWSEWIGRFHRQRKRYEQLEKRGFVSAQAIGLFVLGLTSVYREGFETVLFLQSLELSAGTAAVIEGAGLGLALTFAVAAVTFLLQRKLPYKRMLVVTGVMIGFVLVVMVGQTARTMQGTGWLSITPIHADLPYWSGLWFGVYPTWETIAAQVLAAAFVIGSYVLAQEVRVKRPRRKATKAGATPAPAAAGPGDRPTAGAPSEDADQRPLTPSRR
ncbi:FTR1 family protein [Conexibacter sp. SYSU D00693]|uniref:FTR1 family iron permease n=1 Tax=Conexibacter sp. SYSU D00693 TaxID=2812560 RepID=UPI00196AF4E7|nr:FTR1 family protein [Conexibacter sp. SYSU D00693]